MMIRWWNGLSFLVGNLILEPAHLPVAVSQGVHQGALLSLQHISLVNGNKRYALIVIPLTVKQIQISSASKDQAGGRRPRADSTIRQDRSKKVLFRSEDC
jgi:hypothetical protein